MEGNINKEGKKVKKYGKTSIMYFNTSEKLLNETKRGKVLVTFMNQMI